jgi:predicted nucleotide-binding protein
MEQTDHHAHCLVLTTAAPADTEIRHHTDGLIEYVVRPAVEAAEYELIRMDKLASPGMVSDAVIRELYTADIVVADLSFGDPMVMYALGIRHSFDLPAIHLITPSSTFPFDVEGLSAISFDINDASSVRRARRELSQRMEDRVSLPEASPVQATVELDQLRRVDHDEGSELERILANGLRAIEQRIDGLERRFERQNGTATTTGTAEVGTSRRIFIVHGHDGELKHQLARLLRRLQFEPVILQELPDSGRTLIEKLRAEVAEIGFAFILLTPDDVGQAKTDADGMHDRARQNVIFEHGLFSALLDPSRVCAVQRGEVEIPSDLSGLVIKRIPDGSGIMTLRDRNGK